MKNQNGGEIHLHMNKKENDYQNVNLTQLLNCFSSHDSGAEKNILVFIVHRLTYSLS